MTAPATTVITPLSEKLSLVTHHHLLTRVPVKLDLDDWNYGSWEYFFEQLCSTYEVDKYIKGSSTTTDTSTPSPLSSEEQKVDKIVLSWLFTTLSDSLQRRLVVARPKTSRDAWTMITDIVKDNKRPRTAALKAELRSLKLGDTSMEAYFGKIESLTTILTSLGSPVNEEDIVHFALEGLPDKYDQVCGIMHHKDVFPDLKTARSMLITEEMRLKSKSLASPLDYSTSSPMVLMTDSGNNRRPNNQVKSWRPCYNFAKGSCRFGESCKFVHDPTIKNRPVDNGGSKEKVSDDILAKLLERMGMSTQKDPIGQNPKYHSPAPNPSVAFHVGHSGHYSPHTPPTGPYGPPPGFSFWPSPPFYYTPFAGAYPSPVPQFVPTSQQPTISTSQVPSGANSTQLGQETVLPHAFTTGTLKDPNTNAWNMDTGFHDSTGSAPM